MQLTYCVLISGPHSLKKCKLANAGDSEKVSIFRQYPVSHTVANLNSTCSLENILLQVLSMAVYSCLAYKAKQGFELLTMTFLRRKEGKYYFILEICHLSFFCWSFELLLLEGFYFSFNEKVVGKEKKSPF